jgi:hypothetical protein
MFLGIVANLQVTRNFDGQILLEWVGWQKTVLQASRNKQFTKNVLANKAISTSRWHDLVHNDMT